MTKPLKLILLIDDDEATNYLHRIMIDDAECTEETYVTKNGKAALEYLRSSVEGQHPQPDLIFLDINMPIMDGWDFLEEYQKLDEAQKGKIVLIMLTTSVNPDDYEKAKNYPDVAGFKNKPLTVELLHEIVENHFKEI